jgi:hypothetical protein
VTIVHPHLAEGGWRICAQPDPEYPECQPDPCNNFERVAQVSARPRAPA